MARGRRDGILIAGGGLAGALAALAMARHRPDVPLLIVEEAKTFGGAGMRSFSDAELGDDGADLIGAEKIARWPGIYLSFPGMNRNLRLDWGRSRPRRHTGRDPRAEPRPPAGPRLRDPGPAAQPAGPGPYPTRPAA
jgi:hypothetical protein